MAVSFVLSSDLSICLQDRTESFLHLFQFFICICDALLVWSCQGNEISESGRTASFDAVLPEILANLSEQKYYVAVEFLKNVSQGDKRVIIINGKIMGCSLRIPQPGNWLCNGSQGGRLIILVEMSYSLLFFAVLCYAVLPGIPRNSRTSHCELFMPRLSLSHH